MDILFPYSLPGYFALRDIAERTEPVLKLFTSTFQPAPETKSGRSLIRLYDSQHLMLKKLMQSARKNGHPGQYVGAAADLERTRMEADMSGDNNEIHLNLKKPHPLFKKLIAHGAGILTQAFAALRIHISPGLAPANADIKFLGPVFLGEDRLKIRIKTGESPMDHEIQVFAHNVALPNRVVLEMRVTLVLNPDFGEAEWFHILMSAWRISALLAETWPNCLYRRQSLEFNHPMKGDSLGVIVRGEGFSNQKDQEKGYVTVDTQAHDFGCSHTPSVHGKAIISLYRGD